MLPSVFHDSLFDTFFDDDLFRLLPSERGHDPLYGKHAKALMRTDIRQTDGGYELDIDLPGFQKDQIRVDLQNGYLTIRADKELDKNSDNGRFIRRERYSGSLSRSFYVGDLKPEDIRAKYEDGILHLQLPSQDRKALPQNTAVTID